MDRISSSLDGDDASPHSSDRPLMVHGEGDAHLVEDSTRHLAIPEKLFNLNELEVLYESERETLWTYMRPSG